MQEGIDPTKLKNANQVENAVKMIERPNVQQGIRTTKSAKVFDLEGKEIDPKKGIMGGKQIPDDDLHHQEVVAVLMISQLRYRARMRY